MQTNNAVAVQQPAKPMDRFKQELGLREDMLKKMLPKGMTVDKFQAVVVAAVADNMDLLDCDRGSLLKSCIQAAELGLTLNKSMAEADILKVWNGRAKRNEAQFRPRYKGLMKLALQSGEVLKIESRIVHENDEFEIVEGTDAEIIHKRKLGNRGAMIGAYCVWTLKSGEKQFEVMSKEEIEAIRDRSSSKTKEGKVVGPWMTDPAEMWRKTVVRRATKYMPMSPEAARAVHADNVAEGVEDIDHGPVMDITDYDEETGEIFTADPAPAASQLDQIASKIKAEPAPAPAPAAPTIPFVEVPLDGDGYSDWEQWCCNAINAVTPLTAADRNLWAKRHQGLIGEAELMGPSSIGELIEMLS